MLSIKNHSFLKGLVGGLVIASLFLLVFFIFLPAPAVNAQAIMPRLPSSNYAISGDIDVKLVIENIIDGILAFLGFLAVIIVLYGGFLWMTAAGDDQRIDKAKETLRNGLIGLVIILCAWLIVTMAFNLILTGNIFGDGGDDDGPGPGPGPRPRVESPRVLSHYPRRDQNGVIICSVIWAEIGTTNPWSLTSGDLNSSQIKIESCGTGDVFGSCTDISDSFDCSASETLITCLPPTPDYLLDVETWYRATLFSGAIMDASGDEINFARGEDYSWQFKTGTENYSDLPEVVSGSEWPENFSTNACLKDDIKAVFNHDMYPSSLTSEYNFELTPTGPEFNRYHNIDRFSFAPQFSYAEKTEYVVILKSTSDPSYDRDWWLGNSTPSNKGMRDVCGNPLNGDSDPEPDDYSWSFTTGTNDRCDPEIDAVENITLSKYDQGYHADEIKITGNYFTNSGTLTFYNGINLTYPNNPSNPVDKVCFDDGSSGYFNPNRYCVISWANNEIHVRVPAAGGDSNGVRKGKIKMETSTEKPSGFSSVFEALSPHIFSISGYGGDAAQGGSGQMITIFGVKFGESGKVKFIGSSGSFIANGQVPPIACGDTWTDNRIVILVPAGVPTSGIGSIQILSDDPSGTIDKQRSSNLVQFTYIDEIGPGICKVEPTCASAGETDKVDIVGTQFGSSGSVYFGGYLSPDLGVWTENSINDIDIPAASVIASEGNYPVHVEVGSRVSNYFSPFSIPCGAPLSCDSVPTTPGCDPADEMCPINYICSAIEGCICKGLPQVKNKWPDCSCSQTGGDWTCTKNACINTKFKVEFTREADSTFLNNDYIKLIECANSVCNVIYDSGIDIITGGGGVTLFNFIVDDNLVIFEPLSGNLSKDKFYRLILKEEIRFSDGLSLGGLNYSFGGGTANDSYSWVFKTKDTDLPCQADGIELRPVNPTITVEDTVNFYTILSASNNCNNAPISDSGLSYSYNWSNTNVSVASLPVCASGTCVVSAIGEGTTTIGAEISSLSISDNTLLTVNPAPSLPGPGEMCASAGTVCLTDSCSHPMSCLGTSSDCRCCCNPLMSGICGDLDCIAGAGNCTGLDRGLCCGCTVDSQCPDSSNNGCGINDGRTNHCCYSRPVVIDFSPLSLPGPSWCRNSAFHVIFSEEMKISTFDDNIEFRNPAGAEVDGEILPDADRRGFVFYPTGCDLPPRTDYYKLILYGGQNGEGLTSSKGVSLSRGCGEYGLRVGYYDCEFENAVENRLCEVDHTVVNPSNVNLTVGGYRDFSAAARDAANVTVCIGDGSWSWSAVPSGVVDVSSPGNQTATITASIVGSTVIKANINVGGANKTCSTSPDNYTCSKVNVSSAGGASCSVDSDCVSGCCYLGFCEHEDVCLAADYCDDFSDRSGCESATDYNCCWQAATSECRIEGHCSGGLTCTTPWPGPDLDDYYEDSSVNFKIKYCRDGALPAPTSVVDVPHTAGIPLIKDYLLPFAYCSNNVDTVCTHDTGCPDGKCIHESIGIQVWENRAHYAPERWVREQEGIRALSSAHTPVGGYEATQIGRTIYVSAGNDAADGHLYTNIYLISYSEGASEKVKNIYNQIIKNFEFNNNLAAVNKPKLTRDVKRLADLNKIAELLESYKLNHSYYPKLEAGTYVKGQSYSKWPSWQANLGNLLGKSLAEDPLNQWTCASDYNQQTCWDETREKFDCSADANIYAYRLEGRCRKTADNILVLVPPVTIGGCECPKSCFSNSDCGTDEYCGKESSYSLYTNLEYGSIRWLEPDGRIFYDVSDSVQPCSGGDYNLRLMTEGCRCWDYSPLD